MLYAPPASSFISIQFFVDFVYCLTSLLFFDIPLLQYYRNITIINNSLSFFWRYVSLFRYFFIILNCNCFWIILLWIFLRLRDSATARLFYSQFINNFLAFFWKYISFFRYFFAMPICNCIRIILLWNFLGFHNVIRKFITSQIVSYACCFFNKPSWSSFKCIWSRLFSIIKRFLNIFTS